MSRIRFSYAKEEDLKEVPQELIVHDLSLYSCNFTKNGLKAFLDRPTVSLRKLELSSMDANSAITGICSHPQTKLAEFRISSCYEHVTTRSVAALVKHPLKVVRILDTDFEVGAFGALLERLSVSGVREIEFASLPELVLQECGTSFGKLTTLQVLSLNSCPFPDRAYEEFKNLRALHQLFIESAVRLSPAQVANVAALPKLDYLSVGKNALSSEQIAGVLAKRRLKILRLTKRPDLTSDLDVIKQAKIPEFHLYITDELTAQATAQLASMKHLRRLRIENNPDSSIVQRNNQFLIDGLKNRLPRCEVKSVSSLPRFSLMEH